MAELQQLVIKYQQYGHTEIDEFINILDSDDELKKLNYTATSIKQQQIIAKNIVYYIL